MADEGRAVPGWLSRLRDLIVEASPLRRFMLAMFVVLPVVALAGAYYWLNPPVYRVLYAQLSDRAGGEVITALEQLDIPYRLSARDGSIEVPADRLHAARYRLAVQGLPRADEDVAEAEAAVPVFGVSSVQEQQRMQRALESDLARSIQKLDAVELARVHLALPKVSPFLRDAPPATAAVLVRLADGRALSEEQVRTIQTLVAAAVPRMKRADVQVLDPRGVVLGGAAPEPGQTQRLALEADLARRALAVLTPWLGADRVSVQVTATLADGETRQTVEEVRGAAGQARPLERTVRTTRVPQGHVTRIHAIVILGFDASANQRWRAGQLARQALGLQPERGDSLKVYALPGATREAAGPAPADAPAPIAEARPPVQAPASAAEPASIPRVEPRVAGDAPAPGIPQASWLVAGVALLALAAWGWRRRGRASVSAIETPERFDDLLESVRGDVLANPRVAADVIKLWMRT